MGPFGLQQGNVIPDYNFVGFVNSVASSQIRAIELCHFYNPTGLAVYPQGSQYGSGVPKPKALLFALQAVWAGPCNTEAKSVFPAKYFMYKPLGGEFLSVIVEGGPVQGTPPTLSDLTKWDAQYVVDYPSTYYNVDPTLIHPAYPFALIVDLRTMIVSKEVLGVPTAQDWADYATLL